MSDALPVVVELSREEIVVLSAHTQLKGGHHRDEAYQRAKDGDWWPGRSPRAFQAQSASCEPCPHCDADNPQLVCGASGPIPAQVDSVEVGHVLAEQPRPAADADPTTPKPSLCWICGKLLPHDCISGSELPTYAKCGSVTVTAKGRDIIIGSAHHSNGLLVECADVPDLLVAVAEAHGFKHGPPQSGQPILNLELPDGDTREAKVRWTEWSADRKSLGVCISVTHGPPNNAEVSAIIQSWLDKQGHERCWYYPELFNQLAAALGLKATVAPGLPSRQEFARGCDRYQAEQYSNAQTAITHGPPQSQQSAAANSFAPSAPTATARKWPIGTPSDDHYNLAWGFRLQQARAHRGHTLDALGARLNPPRTRKDISAMEHGRRGLSVELCAELAQALDCDRCWLAGWK